MKKLFVFLMVLGLLAAAAVPALAAGGPPAWRGGNAKGANMPFAFSGTIAGLQEGIVTVTAICGNKVVRPYIDQDLPLQIDDGTRFLLRDPEGTATPITFEDLKVNDQVSVHGKIIDDVWTIDRITVGAELTCLP